MLRVPPSVAIRALALAGLAVVPVAMVHAALLHIAPVGGAARRAHPLAGVALLARAAVQAHRAGRGAAPVIGARVALARARMMHRPGIVAVVHRAVMAVRAGSRREQRQRRYQNSYTRQAHYSVLPAYTCMLVARRRQAA